MVISCRGFQKSHTFKLTQEDLIAALGHPAVYPQVIADLMAKLTAEHERLKRIVPDVPGHHWEYEAQQSEDDLSNEFRFRVVARLKEDKQ